MGVHQQGHTHASRPSMMDVESQGEKFEESLHNKACKGLSRLTDVLLMQDHYSDTVGLALDTPSSLSIPPFGLFEIRHDGKDNDTND